MAFFSKNKRAGEAELPRRRSSRQEPLRKPKLMAGQDDYTFRRSRTLIGSLSSSVESAGAHRPDLKSDRLKLHELHAHRRLVQTSLAVSLLLILFTLFLISNSVTMARTVHLTTSDVPAADTDKYAKTLEQYLNSRPLQAFLVTLDQAQLTKMMQLEHPEIESVEVRNGLMGMSGGVIEYRFREAVAVWQIGDSRFYVDENGTAFTRYYGADPELRVEDDSGYVPRGNNDQAPVASKRFIGYLGQMLGAIRIQQVGAVERIVIPASARQFDVYLEGRAYPIKTHVDRDPYAQVEDMKHALNYLDKKARTPQYLDVRVEGKAYYK